MPTDKNCPCLKKFKKKIDRGTRRKHKCMRSCWKKAREEYQKAKQKEKEGKTFFYYYSIIATLPWIALLTLLVSIELVSSLADCPTMYFVLSVAIAGSGDPQSSIKNCNS